MTMSVDLRFPDLAMQQRLRHYITATWDTLTRDLIPSDPATADSKVECSDTTTATLIDLSDREDATAVLATIRSKIGNRADGIEIRTLPPEPAAITEHGLLYVPGPYVVPGRRFN
jgi:alpha,alpha-trehalase